MTPVEHVAQSQGESLSLAYDLPHPPEKVWRALTDPALLAEWLLPVVGFELVPGAAFTFRTQAYPGWDGTVHCQVVEIEPRRMLRYTWRVPFLETVVTFTLTPTTSGTRLSIVQSGFGPEQKREFGGARYGWTMMGSKLTTLLERMP
jgi:uncharacterized protein YndB with AHSA1/START domain